MNNEYNARYVTIKAKGFDNMQGVAFIKKFWLPRSWSWQKKLWFRLRRGLKTVVIIAWPDLYTPQVRQTIQQEGESNIVIVRSLRGAKLDWGKRLDEFKIMSDIVVLDDEPPWHWTDRIWIPTRRLSLHMIRVDGQIVSRDACIIGPGDLVEKITDERLDGLLVALNLTQYS